MMIYLGIVLLLIAVAVGWLLTLFSLPGNWLIVLAAALFAYFTPEDSPWDLGWGWVAALLILALVGEVIEFIAAALGVKKHGGSRRGALLAIVGSLAGAMLGAAVGLPIPIVGSVAGVILGASFGAMAGAMLGEAWIGTSTEQRWRIGQGAFWGRLFGSLAKTAIGSLMSVLVVVALMLSLFR
jgi:uncharacterized protein YqgC (DUF456 family)